LVTSLLFTPTHSTPDKYTNPRANQPWVSGIVANNQKLNTNPPPQFLLPKIDSSFSPIFQIQNQHPGQKQRAKKQKKSDCATCVPGGRQMVQRKMARCQVDITPFQPAFPKQTKGKKSCKQATTRREPIRVNAIPQPRSRSSTIHSAEKEEKEEEKVQNFSTFNGQNPRNGS
jgi:hypothetical protein